MGFQRGLVAVGSGTRQNQLKREGASSLVLSIRLVTAPGAKNLKNMSCWEARVKIQETPNQRRCCDEKSNGWGGAGVPEAAVVRMASWVGWP